MTHRILDTYRLQGTGGAGRATYRPDWSPTLPWVVYVDGAAKVHRETIEQVFNYLKTKGINKIVSRPATA